MSKRAINRIGNVQTERRWHQGGSLPVEQSRARDAIFSNLLPDLVYRLVAQVAPFRGRLDREIAAWNGHTLQPSFAHHLMIEAVRADAIPVSRLPHVIEAWEKPKHEIFEARTAWPLGDAFTDVQKSRSPRAQIEGNLRLTDVFRKVLLN